MILFWNLIELITANANIIMFPTGYTSALDGDRKTDLGKNCEGYTNDISIFNPIQILFWLLQLEFLCKFRELYVRQIFILLVLKKLKSSVSRFLND